MTTRRLAPWLVIGLLAVALACSDDDDVATGTREGTGGTPTTAAQTTAGAEAGAGTTAPTPPAGTSSTSGGSAGSGCAGGGPQPPAGAGVGRVDDLDGDGRPDRAWFAPPAPPAPRRLGVTTAAGGGDVVEVRSASPAPFSVLAVDADETPPVELFVSDGRTVQLWVFADCRLRPVTNPEGEQYLFDLGFRGTGTGVGCRDVPGGRQLVGLNVADDDGRTVDWTRTVIERDGLSARNGPTDSGTFTRPGDAAAIDLLHTVSCGDETIAADGVREPEV